MKKSLAILLSALLALALCACAGTEIRGAANATADAATVIGLNGASAEVKGGGASVSGAVVTVSAAGAYTLRGTLDGGQIVVDTGEDPGAVTLFLDGAEISNSADAAILVRQAKRVVISTVKGSENRVRSGPEGELVPADENANGAAVFSEDDLAFTGEGSLRIDGCINNAVTCKDDLEVQGGYLLLRSANNGLRGSESVTVSGGELDIDTLNDGIKATSAKKDGKGYVQVSGGMLRIASGGDALSAETEISISGGMLTLVTAAQGDKSCKALKANVAVAISGGDISIVSADDGIRTDGDVTVSGGRLQILSEKKGIQAGVKNSTEGALHVSGGELRIIAADDGVDAKGALTVDGGLLLSLGASKRPKGFSDDCAQPVLEAELSAAKGDSAAISVGGSELARTAELRHPANLLLFSAPELERGAEYTVTAGTDALTVAAR